MKVKVKTGARKQPLGTLATVRMKMPSAISWPLCSEEEKCFCFFCFLPGFFGFCLKGCSINYLLDDFENFLLQIAAMSEGAMRAL